MAAVPGRFLLELAAFRAASGLKASTIGTGCCDESVVDDFSSGDVFCGDDFLGDLRGDFLGDSRGDRAVAVVGGGREGGKLLKLKPNVAVFSSRALIMVSLVVARLLFTVNNTRHRVVA